MDRVRIVAAVAIFIYDELPLGSNKAKLLYDPENKSRKYAKYVPFGV
jgi:hypothetical protein